MKTDSISVKNTYETTKIAKRKPYSLISLRSINLGLKMLINKTNIKLMNNATMPDMQKHELIMLLFSFDFERYLTSAILNPNNENMDISSNEEINVEANPTCVVEYSLTTILQKRRPKPDNTTEFKINHNAFL